MVVARFWNELDLRHHGTEVRAGGPLQWDRDEDSAVFRAEITQGSLGGYSPGWSGRFFNPEFHDPGDLRWRVDVYADVQYSVDMDAPDEPAYQPGGARAIGWVKATMRNGSSDPDPGKQWPAAPGQSVTLK